MEAAGSMARVEVGMIMLRALSTQAFEPTVTIRSRQHRAAATAAVACNFGTGAGNPIVLLCYV